MSSAVKMETAQFFIKLASTNQTTGDLTQNNRIRTVTAVKTLNLTSPKSCVQLS
jgi:hypothetical protein